MANQRHVDILKQGVEVWNRWREKNPGIVPDLSGARLMKIDLSGIHLSDAQLFRTYLNGAHLINAHLMGANLREADLSGADCTGAKLNGAHLNGAKLNETNLSQASLIKADLHKADFRSANLHKADFRSANLREALFHGAKLSFADLSEADLGSADLSEADLIKANLTRTDLDRTDLRNAHLNGATLIGATFTHTDLSGADLTECKIFGSSAWNVRLDGAVQKDLVITECEEPVITVDNLEVAQFIYLLLNNQKIRDVITTITSKVVLILGRFTAERKAVLDALREELRQQNFSPVVFDFDPSAKRNMTETISLLANMSRFVIADLTDERSVPQELERIVPHNPSVPVQPILHIDAIEYAMFESYKKYPWVLPVYRYEDISDLLASMKEHILMPVEQKEYEESKKKALEEKITMLENKLREMRPVK